MKSLASALAFSALLGVGVTASGTNAVLAASSWSAPENCVEINSNQDDYAPAWNVYDGKLYFNSMRNGKSMFYSCSANDSNSFSQVLPVKGLLNSESCSRSYIVFADATTAYLSCFKPGKVNSYLNIFKTMIKRNAWCEPFFIESINSESFTAHPAVSPDGTSIVFASDRKAPGVESDLFMSQLQPDGSWGSPIALEELNSPGQEITPFFANDSLLFFASDGLGGPGGFDIYKTEQVDGQWQRPEPLIELNTEFNESDFILLPSGKAHFASDRPGGKGKLDIYQSHAIDYIEPTKLQNEELALSMRTLSYKVKIEQITTNTNLPVSRLVRIEQNGFYPDFSTPSSTVDSPDKSIQHSNYLIANNINLNKIEQIELEYNPADKAKATEFANRFIESFRLDAETIKLIEVKELRAGLLRFNADNAVFACQYSTDEFKATPPANEFILDGNISSAAKFVLRTNDAKLKAYDVKKLPDTLRVDYTKIAEELNNADSLVATVYPQGVTAFGDEIVINISKAKTVINRTVSEANAKYADFYMICDPSDIKNINKALSDNATEIAALARYSKSLKVFVGQKTLDKVAEQNLRNSIQALSPQRTNFVIEKSDSAIFNSNRLGAYIINLRFEQY